MRDQLKVQELMDTHLDSRDEELCQLHSQSQEDGAKMAALLLQLQEVISLVEEQSKVVEKNIEDINNHFYCHQEEINHLKKREVELKEKEEELRGYILGAAHEAEVFKSWLDQMEGKVCQCGHTPSEVGEKLCSEEDARMELSYASARGSKHIVLWWRIQFPSPFQLPVTHVACPLYFLLWKRLQKNLLVPSVIMWMLF